MNTWEVPGEKGAALMDKLFITSQNTGVGLTKLSNIVRTYGPVLKNLGFGLDESIALFGSFEKAGIDVSRVMPGLNAATRRWAQEGLNLKDQLNVTIDAIKNTEDAAEALNIATDAFGAEGAQRMSVAIRTGALDLEGLTKAIGNSEGSIVSMGKETMTMGDKTKKLWHSFTVAIEPVLTKVLDLAMVIIDKLTPAIKLAGEWIGANLSPALDSVGKAIGGVIEKIAPMIRKFTAMFSSMGGPGGIGVIQRVKDAIGGIVSVVSTMVQNVRKLISRIDFSSIISAVQSVIPLFAKLGALISEKIGPFVQTMIDRFKDFADTVGPLVQPAIQNIVNFLGKALSTIVGFFRKHWDKVEGIVGGVWKAITGIIDIAWSLISGIIHTAMAVFAGDWSEAWEAIKNMVSGIWGGIQKVIGGFLGIIKNEVGLAWEVIKSVASTAWGAIGGVITAAWEGIKSATGSAVNWIIDRLNDLAAPINAVITGLNLIKPGADIPKIELGHVRWGQGNIAVPTTEEDVERFGRATAAIPRQLGGPAMPGQNYLVGERGVEIFKPTVPGVITPIGDTDNRTLNVTVVSPSPANVLDRFQTDPRLREFSTRRKKF